MEGGPPSLSPPPLSPQPEPEPEPEPQALPPPLEAVTPARDSTAVKSALRASQGARGVGPSTPSAAAAPAPAFAPQTPAAAAAPMFAPQTPAPPLAADSAKPSEMRPAAAAAAPAAAAAAPQEADAPTGPWISDQLSQATDALYSSMRNPDTMNGRPTIEAGEGRDWMHQGEWWARAEAVDEEDLLEGPSDVGVSCAACQHLDDHQRHRLLMDNVREQNGGGNGHRYCTMCLSEMAEPTSYWQEASGTLHYKGQYVTQKGAVLSGDNGVGDKEGAAVLAALRQGHGRVRCCRDR